jgi:hypothetical protein
MHPLPHPLHTLLHTLQYVQNMYILYYILYSAPVLEDAGELRVPVRNVLPALGVGECRYHVACQEFSKVRIFDRRSHNRAPIAFTMQGVAFTMQGECRHHVACLCVTTQGECRHHVAVSVLLRKVSAAIKSQCPIAFTIQRHSSADF